MLLSTLCINVLHFSLTLRGSHTTIQSSHHTLACWLLGWQLVVAVAKVDDMADSFPSSLGSSVAMPRTSHDCKCLRGSHCFIQNGSIQGVLPGRRRKGAGATQFWLDVPPGTFTWLTSGEVVQQTKLMLFWGHALGYVCKHLFLHAHLVHFLVLDVVFSWASFMCRVFRYLAL